MTNCVKTHFMDMIMGGMFDVDKGTKEVFGTGERGCWFKDFYGFACSSISVHYVTRLRYL